MDVNRTRISAGRLVAAIVAAGSLAFLSLPSGAAEAHQAKHPKHAKVKCTKAKAKKHPRKCAKSKTVIKTLEPDAAHPKTFQSASQ